MAMSHSPATTSAALPLEEPPADRFGSCGLSTGPVSEVWLPPEKQRFSQTDLPTISPPASRMRVTTVASTSGTYPSSVDDPFIIGTPARQIVSFTTTCRPASGPSAAPLIDVFTYQAWRGSSSGVGNRPGVRGYRTSGMKSGID